jgi:hypothetical protein
LLNFGPEYADMFLGCGDDHETGSIITMTSDERVQIYVPSPLETTPYNTITRQVEQVQILGIVLIPV